MKIENISYDKEFDILRFYIDGERYEVDGDGDLELDGKNYYPIYVHVNLLREIVKLYDRRKTLDK